MLFVFLTLRTTDLGEMPNRREFLAASGFGAGCPGNGRLVAMQTDSTWLVYAPNVEQFWSNLPFLERLKKIGEAGFTRYEFGRWKTKDTQAITKANEELGLQTAIFNGYPGPPKGAKWKEGLLDAAGDSAESGPRPGRRQGRRHRDRPGRERRPRGSGGGPGRRTQGVGREAGRVGNRPDSRTGQGPPKKPVPLITTVEEAAEVVKASRLGSGQVRLPDRKSRGARRDWCPTRSRNSRIRSAITGSSTSPRRARGRNSAYARVLRAIHDIGYADPIGLGLAPKGDPLAAIEAIRKLDDAAKAL